MNSVQEIGRLTLMITVPEAFTLIQQTIVPASPVLSPLGECHGLTLADAIIATQDSPPFDKALMDGFAVRSQDIRGPGTTLRILERLTAGQVPALPLQPVSATQVMTGTAVPEGCDAVVRCEDVASADLESISVSLEGIASGRNVMRRGESLRTGETVLQAGTSLTPSRLGLLAELGHARVPVFPRPRVAVLATGNELVPVDQEPGPGEIRNSNEPMLCAQLLACGAVPVPLGIARDDREELRAKIVQGLGCDFLLLSGGVSAGVLDLVPSVLAECGVKQVFHQVNLKPGKPIWFGHFSASASECAVFGLPGNPVSSLVCFELFVKPALGMRCGRKIMENVSILAELTQAHLVKGDRPVYYPARWNIKEGIIQATPAHWVGSADLRGTAEANGMILFEPRETSYEVGDRVVLFPWGADLPRCEE